MNDKLEWVNKPTCGIEEAAAILNVHRTTVLQLAGSGELEGAKIGKEWVFVVADVIEHVRRQAREQARQRRAEADAQAELVKVEKPVRARRRALPNLSHAS